MLQRHSLNVWCMKMLRGKTESLNSLLGTRCGCYCIFYTRSVKNAKGGNAGLKDRTAVVLSTWGMLVFVAEIWQFLGRTRSKDHQRPCNSGRLWSPFISFHSVFIVVSHLQRLCIPGSFFLALSSCPGRKTAWYFRTCLIKCNFILSFSQISHLEFWWCCCSILNFADEH